MAQRVVKVSFTPNHDTLREVNNLLAEGWKVVNMVNYSQSVTAYHMQGKQLYNDANVYYGDYGVIFVLEKEEKRNGK